MRLNPSLTLKTLSVLTLVAATGATMAFPNDARACGGCFVPTENNTVVTDHRMILTIDKTTTTLYDQIRYQGSPDKFAWVLPISSEATVGLSADVVFASLDAISQTQVQQPPTNCPPPPDCDYRNASAPTAGGTASDNGGVEVTKRETVGPYETVQLKASDPAALNTWLATNGFTVPNDVKPIIATYVAEHFDFLALKLIPGAGIGSMRPVRVSTSGAAPVLPLRMVAAGTGPVVGITLWILGEGRYEPQNFPKFTITDDDLIWDWTTSTSNYKALRASRTTDGSGRAWEIESSQSAYPQQIENLIQYGGRGGGGVSDGSDDYLPVVGENGVITKSASQVRAEDLAVLIPGGNVNSPTRLTRVRADLNHGALTEDLILSATPTQDELSTRRVPKHEANQPQCAIYAGCNAIGTKPRDEATAYANAQGQPSVFGGSSCSATPPKATRALRTGGAGLLALGGLGLATALIGRARRKRSGK